MAGEGDEVDDEVLGRGAEAGARRGGGRCWTAAARSGCRRTCSSPPALRGRRDRAGVVGDAGLPHGVLDGAVEQQVRAAGVAVADGDEGGVRRRARSAKVGVVATAGALRVTVGIAVRLIGSMSSMTSRRVRLVEDRHRRPAHVEGEGAPVVGPGRRAELARVVVRAADAAAAVDRCHRATSSRCRRNRCCSGPRPRCRGARRAGRPAPGSVTPLTRMFTALATRPSEPMMQGRARAGVGDDVGEPVDRVRAAGRVVLLLGLDVENRKPCPAPSGAGYRRAGADRRTGSCPGARRRGR